MTTMRSIGCRAAALALLALGGSACVSGFGPKLEDFDPAHGPRGIEASLAVGRPGPVRGELLEVRDDELLLVVGEVLTVIALEAIRQGDFQQVGRLILSGRFTNDGREVARITSRYPAGLTADQFRTLLAAHGQNEPVRVP